MNTSIPKRILLTGARAPATLHLARILKEAGHTVFVADSIGFHLCKHSTAIKKSFLIPSPVSNLEGFKASLLTIVKNEKLDLIIPTCEEIFHISRIKDSFPTGLLFVTDIETLRTLHSKYDFIQSLGGYQHLISIPKTKLLSKKEDLNLMSGDIVSKKIVFKPTFSRFGSNVLISDPKKIDLNLDFDRNQEWIAQDFIEGNQVCSYSVVKDGILQAYSCYQTDFSYGLGATVLFEPHFNRIIQDFVSSYVKNINFTGQISFDFIVTKNGDVYPIECNPRLTSGICLFDKTSGVDKSFFEDLDSVLIGTNSSMLAIPTLISIIKDKRFAEMDRWKSSYDVIYKPTDSKPAYYQFYMYVKFFLLAKKHKISVSEATTMDIEWGGKL